MKAVLIVILILVILALLYFFFFKKKKTGAHEIQPEAPQAEEIVERAMPVAEEAEVSEAPAEEILPVVEEEVPAAEEAVEAAVEEVCAAAEEEAPAEEIISLAEEEAAAAEESVEAVIEEVRAFAEEEAVKYLSPVCLGDAAVDTEGKYKRIIAINLEAPNSGNNKICEFAMVYDDEGTKYSAVNLLDPEADFDRDSSRAIFENAGKCPTFPELWKELYELFDGSLVIAHNTAFDVSVLKKTIAAYGLDFPKFDVACTYRLSRKYHPELDNFRLGTVCKFYDIPLVAEEAVSHGNACYEIFRKLIAEGVPVYEEAKEFTL